MLMKTPPMDDNSGLLGLVVLVAIGLILTRDLGSPLGKRAGPSCSAGQ